MEKEKDIKKTVEEVAKPSEELQAQDPVNSPAPEPQQELKYGYMIAIKSDDTLSFEILGEQPGVAELLGLHVIAQEKLLSQMDIAFWGKFSLLFERLRLMSTEIKEIKKALAGVEEATEETKEDA